MDAALKESATPSTTLVLFCASSHCTRMHSSSRLLGTRLRLDLAKTPDQVINNISYHQPCTSVSPSLSFTRTRTSRAATAAAASRRLVPTIPCPHIPTRRQKRRGARRIGFLVLEMVFVTPKTNRNQLLCKSHKIYSRSQHTHSGHSLACDS